MRTKGMRRNKKDDSGLFYTTESEYLLNNED